MADWTEDDTRGIRGPLAWRFFQGYWDEVRRDDPDYTPWSQQSLPMKVLGLIVVIPMAVGMLWRHRRPSV